MDAELVRTIAEQVMKMLKEQGLAGRPARAAEPAPGPTLSGRPAPVRQRLAPAAAKGEPELAGKPSPITALGRVFVTAEALQSRLAGSEKGGVIELTCNEFLTPNAADLAEARHLTIRRAAASLPRSIPSSPGNPHGWDGTAPRAASPHAAVAIDAPGRTIGVVAAKADDKVNALLGGLAREKVNLLKYDSGACWIANLLALCRDVAAGQLPAGVAIVPQAADAMVLAGKVKGVRPVQATMPESLARAMRSFGANMLILEAASGTYHQMRTMIRLLAAGGPAGAQTSPLHAALVELEG